jgi:wobble nucleotide-excising tRNase
LYEDLRSDYSVVALAIKQIEERISDRLDELASALRDKKTRVEDDYRVVRRPIGGLLALRARLIGKLNQSITEHNKRVSEGASAREDAKRHVVLHYACSGAVDARITVLEKEADFLLGWVSRSRGIKQGIETRLARVRREIEVASIGTEKVNQYIRLYFGSDRLRVVSLSGRYRVYRESQVASVLSEGEKTAISFAYFMARLEESRVTLANTIVYIDDPVSSLDANHIFNTFSIIRTKLDGCAQLFVSTHHYEFFRLMKDDSFFREWSDKKNAKRRTSYYRVVRSGDESRIEDLPPALRRYSSEYQLLVSTLFEFESDAGFPPFLIPNVLRRVLEAYTSFRFPSTTETLDRRIGKIFLDPAVSARVYKLINHFSHAGSPNVILELPAEEEVREVTGLVLTRLREFDPEHFSGLAEVVGASR